jgi:hypothetical protein
VRIVHIYYINIETIFIYSFYDDIRKFTFLLGHTAIEKITIPTKSRDELPPVLAGLQWIFTTPEINDKIFKLLEDTVIGNIKRKFR